MSTALTTDTGLPYNPFLATADEMGARMSLLYTKFDGNTGKWTFGKDNSELKSGTTVAFNHREIFNGYICWEDSTVKEEIMVNILNGGVPPKASLKDHSPNGDGEYTGEQDGWREQSSIQFKSLEDGKEFQFKTSSKSGRIAVANLVKAFGQQFQMREGKVAIIELGAQQFDAKNAAGKKLGKKYAPSLRIVNWVDEADLISGSTDDETDYDDAPIEEVPAPTPAAPAQRKRF